MKFKKFFFKKVNSTNDIAIKKIKSGHSNGIIISDYQKRGRGQYGKKWISFKGNLFLSIFFKIKKKNSIKKLTILNCHLLKKLLSKCFKQKITIKHPNDLLINNKKFCGILQETTFNDKDKFIIIGIGLNLIKNPKIKKYPTTNILEETGLKIKKLNLAKKIENIYSINLKLFA